MGIDYQIDVHLVICTDKNNRTTEISFITSYRLFPKHCMKNDILPEK